MSEGVVSKRWDLLNLWIHQLEAKRYLEIGLRDGRCFDRIVCETKISVDPSGARARPDFCMKSRDFWRQYSGEPFDVIFIDGSHLAEDVLLDLEQAIHFITIHGAVFVHDLLPAKKEHQVRKYDGRGTWNGDGWKAWIHFKRRHPELDYVVYDLDHGIGKIQYKKLFYEDDLELVSMPRSIEGRLL